MPGKEQPPAMLASPTRRLQIAVARVLGRARVVIYVALLLVVGYHLWRYDMVQIPAGGTSPLDAFPPGTRLIVDVQAGEIVHGDAVLYRTPAGKLLLGRVEPPPADAPDEVLEACARGSFWIVKDRAGVPGEDSLVLGPLGRDTIAGKIAGTLPW